MPPNTRIHYLYRDADNYKAGREPVVAGRLTFEDIEPFLFESEWFIPQVVGIEGAQPDLFKYKGGVASADHVFHEIDRDCLTPCDDAPTVTVTAEQLLAAFRAAHERAWPVGDVARALGIALG